MKARLISISAPSSPNHETVNHKAEEYARGDVYTNTVEGYYSIFKRGMKGVYQHCAEKHLHRYLSEFDFRYSNRIALGVPRQHQHLCKRRFELAIALDLAADVANDAAEIGPQLLEHPVGALELLGVGITLVLDQGELAYPRIGLTQIHPAQLRQPHQFLARPVQKLGIGGEHHVLGLHRGIDDHP